MYKIKQNIINKRKRSPFFVLLYAVGIAVLFSLPIKADNFDWIGFFIIFGGAGIISVGANIKGAIEFITYAKNHELIITKDGLKLVELDAYSVLLWESITEVKQKIKRDKTTKLTLKTPSGKVDLSYYENLDKLAYDLKQYINSELWK